ncbi:MAG: hypothetical protein M9894_36945 [Planctomycetes bacterium]|nr:hypothetical protein [Planctomycetota bacterium]
MQRRELGAARALCLAPLLWLTGCLAGYATPRFSGPERVLEAENLRVHTDLQEPDPEQTVQRMEAALRQVVALLGGPPLPPEERAVVFVFQEYEDFIRHSERAGGTAAPNLRGCYLYRFGDRSGRLALFHPTRPRALVVEGDVRREEPRRALEQHVTAFTHTFAHEVGHWLLDTSSFSDLPRWLEEGVCEWLAEEVTNADWREALARGDGAWQVFQDTLHGGRIWSAARRAAPLDLTSVDVGDAWGGQQPGLLVMAALSAEPALLARLQAAVRAALQGQRFALDLSDRFPTCASFDDFCVARWQAAALGGLEERIRHARRHEERFGTNPLLVRPASPNDRRVFERDAPFCRALMRDEPGAPVGALLERVRAARTALLAGGPPLSIWTLLGGDEVAARPSAERRRVLAARLEEVAPPPDDETGERPPWWQKLRLEPPEDG